MLHPQPLVRIGQPFDHPEWLSPARDLHPLHLLHADGVLLGRWRVARLGA